MKEINTDGEMDEKAEHSTGSDECSKTELMRAFRQSVMALESLAVDAERLAKAARETLRRAEAVL
ncbi:MAG: hypothetical protein QM651_17285 [Rhodoblastus sp.]